MSRPSAAPNIDLGGRVQVIEEHNGIAYWKTLARCFCTSVNAKKVMRQHGLNAAWLVDDYGSRVYVTMEEM